MRKKEEHFRSWIFLKGPSAHYRHVSLKNYENIKHEKNVSLLVKESS